MKGVNGVCATQNSLIGCQDEWAMSSKRVMLLYGSTKVPHDALITIFEALVPKNRRAQWKINVTGYAHLCISPLRHVYSAMASDPDGCKVVF